MERYSSKKGRPDLPVVPRGVDESSVAATDKSPTMVLSVLLTWLFCILWFSPRFLELIPNATNWWHAVVLVLFTGFQSVFWLYGAYYFWLFIFSNFDGWVAKPGAQELTDKPPVAILYVTMNDFVHDAAQSCLEQDYHSFHVFILDDSTDKRMRKEIDDFQAQNSGQVTICRRHSRQGFKAGSINFALRGKARDYPFFAIFDSDSVLPDNFLSKMLPHLIADDKIAYVQCSHRPHPCQKSRFARELALSIIPIWSTWYIPRNRYGFLMFLGHGGVLRRSVWEEVGGFPEVICEDLAFSSEARRLGYRGIFIKDVVCLEDFPESYRQHRRQQEKYVRGACEYIHKGYRSFLISDQPRWFEKVDLSLSIGSLFLPPSFLFFIALVVMAQTASFGDSVPLTLSIGDIELFTWPWYVFTERLSVIWTWDFYILVAICTFSPLLGCVNLIFQYPWKTLKLLFISAAPFMSLTLMLLVSVINYMFTGHTSFASTGDKTKASEKSEDSYRRTDSPYLNSPSESRTLIYFELMLGIVLSVISCLILNIVFFAFGLTLILGFFIFLFGWENRVIRPFLYLPLGLILVGLVSMGTNLLGAQGTFVFFFGFHF